jgi:hypothetical protein
LVDDLLREKRERHCRQMESRVVSRGTRSGDDERSPVGKRDVIGCPCVLMASKMASQDSGIVTTSTHCDGTTRLP